MEETKEQVLETLIELKSETRVKAWSFQVEKNYYHLSIYPLFRKGLEGGIWNSNKRGKRLDKEAIFTISSGDPSKCIEEFMKTLS